MIHLKGVGLKGYRSFYGETAFLAPLSKINIFIGRNNAGKSTILKFIDEVLPNAVKNIMDSAQVPFKFEQKIDFPNYMEDVPFEIGFLFDEEKILKDERGRDKCNSFMANFFKYNNQVEQNDSGRWVFFSNNGGNTHLQTKEADFTAMVYRPEFDPEVVEEIAQMIQVDTGNHPTKLSKISTRITGSTIPKLPQVCLIPSFRKIDAHQDGEPFFTGKGLIPKLDQLQRPEDVTDNHNRLLHEKIQKFCRSVLEDPTFETLIPRGLHKLFLKSHGKRRELDSLGTGVHQTVILAAAATCIDNSIICMEEPEIHMHPLLQRKFLRYLAEETTNQYFIATHSSHLMEATKDCSVFHVSLRPDGASSQVRYVTSPLSRFEVCHDLGYKASDLLQTNCIIWVEGPSDRIYLNKWIYQKDNRLIEGLHYSIMFYGGKLFTHLKASQDEEAYEEIAQDFVELSKLNQRFYLVMDSDKKKQAAAISPGKTKFIRAIEDYMQQAQRNQNASFTWVTQGKEIENYIELSQWKEALAEIHPKKEMKNAHGGMFTCRTQLKRGHANKIKMARWLAQQETLTIPEKALKTKLDLDEKLQELLRFIRESNVG